MFICIKNLNRPPPAFGETTAVLSKIISLHENTQIPDIDTDDILKSDDDDSESVDSFNSTAR